MPKQDIQLDSSLEFGTLFEMYDGRPRRKMSRTIGFLSEDIMPKVGGKKFPYTPSGKKAAAEAREKLTAKKAAKKMKGAR